MRRFLIMLLPLLGGLALMSSSRGEGPFPWSFTPESGLPAWQTMRTEGHGKLHVYANTPLYAVKMHRKKHSAPKEELSYFRDQRQLNREVASHVQPGEQLGSLAMVGDIMWIREGWSSFMSPEVRRRLSEFDVLFGNLETPVASGFPVPRNWPVGVTFNSPQEYVRQFRRENGTSLFSALGIANNHALDFGDQGLIQTMDFLESETIPFSGARRSPAQPEHVVVKGPSGVRIGFHATSFGMNYRKELDSSLLLNLIPGLAIPSGSRAPDLSGVAKALQAMRAEGSELNVIAPHWGYEYEMYPDPVQMQVAREMIRLGADIVMGSHPHVPQPDEVCYVNGYEERFPPELRQRIRQNGCLLRDDTGVPRKALVIYSLGNFVTRMTTALCQLGQIRHLGLVRTPDGLIDWTLGGRDWAYNLVKGDGSPEQRLVMLESHRESNCGGQCPQELTDAVHFLREHL